MWINKFIVDKFYAALKILSKYSSVKIKWELNGILTILPINENLIFIIKVVLLIFKENKQVDSCLY